MPPYSRQSAVPSNPPAGNPPRPQVFSIPFQFPDTSLTSVCSADTPPASCPNRLQTMAYDIQQPRSLQYNFTVEQQAPFGMALAVSYVGFRAIHLWQVR